MGIFEILSAQSDCPLSKILYQLGEGFQFSHIFPLPSFTGLFVVHLIACKIFAFDRNNCKFEIVILTLYTIIACGVRTYAFLLSNAI